MNALELRMPSNTAWETSAADAWTQLTSHLEGRPPQLEKLQRAANDRALSELGQTGRQSLQNSVLSLAFLHALLQDTRPFTRPDGTAISVEFGSIDPELLTVGDRLLPAGTSAVIEIDRSPRRILENGDYLARVPVDELSSRLVVPLDDPGVGILSQSTTARIQQILAMLQNRPWDGFEIRCQVLAALDPSVHFLSRAAWDRDVTARSEPHDELFRSLTGNASVSDRLWLAWQEIEQATELIDQHQPGFAALDPQMMLQHDRAEPQPDWWGPLNEHCLQAMTEFYRANDAADKRSRPWSFYWAKRSEYVFSYMASVVAVREAALAKAEGDTERAIEQLEVAVEQLYNAIDHLSDVVRDPSDRALIAALNAYAYQPLVAEYEAMLDGE